jgi:hypothetical protein
MPHLLNRSPFKHSGQVGVTLVVQMEMKIQILMNGRQFICGGPIEPFNGFLAIHGNLKSAIALPYSAGANRLSLIDTYPRT